MLNSNPQKTGGTKEDAKHLLPFPLSVRADITGLKS